MKNKTLKNLSTWLLSIVMIFFVLSLSVVLTLNFKPLYYLDMELLDIPERSGFSEELIRTNYDILIDYNNLWGPDELKFDGLAMSREGRIHFEEVKVIFQGFEIFFFITAAIFIAGAVLKLRQKDIKFLKIGGILTVLFPAAVAALIGLNWDWFFVKFHEIAFDNDYWIFSAETDPVILMLPDEFFMHCALMIVGLTILLSIAALVAHRSLWSKYYGKAHHKELN